MGTKISICTPDREEVMGNNKKLHNEGLYICKLLERLNQGGFDWQDMQQT
jgi:hypothetical protein